VVTQSLAAALPTDRLLKARADAEMPLLARVRELADRVALLPMLPVEPTGEDALLALTSPTGSTVTDRALVG
jgi:arsenite-transporting ATPase